MRPHRHGRPHDLKDVQMLARIAGRMLSDPDRPDKVKREFHSHVQALMEILNQDVPEKKRSA